MKLMRHGQPGHENPGVILQDGTKLDAQGLREDYTPSFFSSGGLERLKEWIAHHGPSAPRVDDSQRLGPPIATPGKMVCVGLNYEDHANEGGQDIPDEPILFFKATSSIVGPDDDLILPKGSKKTDYEVELAVIIGKEACYVSQQEAMGYVAGYCLHNDYSERAFQMERGGQWVKGKSCASFGPLGPFMATKDEIHDITNLNLWLEVNGDRRQQGHTANMIFTVPYLVSYISQFMSLLPGDIISTGTPAGVGLGLDPPQYLKPGDRVELRIDQLGASGQSVKAFNQ